MTVRPGSPSSLTDLISGLREISEALEAGNTWAQIGAALDPPMTGRQAKRHAHKLREQVKAELQELSGRLSAAGARTGAGEG